MPHSTPSRPPFFTPTAVGLEPAPAARGPWAEGMMHGRLLAGLVGEAVEREHGGDGFVPTRLTIDMFRNPPMQPVEVSVVPTRSGGRVRAAESVVQIGGIDVARASVLLLRTGEHGEDPALLATPPWDAPPPETLLDQLNGDIAFDVVSPSGAMFQEPGVRRVWLRDNRELIAGRPLTPFIRVCLAADIASPLANFGPSGLDFINADIGVYIGRLPEGEWIGVETNVRVSASGVSVATCTMHDRVGPIGSASVCAVRNARLPRDV